MKRVVFAFCLLASACAAAESLVEAVRRNDPAKWQALLAARADVNASDALGNTALHYAALNHDVAAARALLAAGAAVNAANAAEATPLIYGAGSAELVELLLAKGANPNAISKQKFTPLFAAVTHPESYASARLLLAAGADPKLVRGTDETALERAVFGGDRRTIDLLLEKETTPLSRSAALNRAAVEGDVVTARRLLELGADPNYGADFNGSALNTTLFNDHRDMARLLIEHGVDLKARSPQGPGTPPMVFAAYNQVGDASVAKALVAAGVDVNATDNQNATALTWALRSGANTPLVAYLRSVGGRTPETARVRQIPDRAVPAGAGERAALAKARLPAALELLRRSSLAFLDNKFVQSQTCTSCHGQDLPAVTLAFARERGFKIDDVALGRQLAAQLPKWTTRAESARQTIRPLPGAPVTISYGLFGLHAAKHPADDTTDAMAGYLLRTQRTEGYWADSIRRPPMEDGPLVATAWAALSVRDYAPAGAERAKADSLARAARWLARQKPETHNEEVFQLLGLHWCNEPSTRLAFARERLLQTQRPDGGWAQLPGLESDAWGTGIALYALHEAGGMPASDAVYQRGVAFLLRTQFEDGSWWVRSRVWPFQPHFDGQFPHGKDQWISQAATAWASIALLFTLEPAHPAITPPTTAQLVAAYQATTREAKAGAALAKAKPVGNVDYVRDVQPLLERSCIGCHGGEKPRARLTMTSVEALLKGGASGEPAIVPGAADASNLIKYVSGKIEDLEMPPLDRREKYPAMSEKEIELLRTWINAGAGAP